ncbi:GNAT family N-acetyltransferase [Aromatoleum diolicum]|uniref:GNAT family N-acetyltransferase n=1 Tax=Aromatoleum diolicum TaxID=75796 RepID=A0ABX1QAC8_9RHOO|nr:GNAT family N-acetyltransferase [Aromatoleum diolicum]NMG74985.1 GNAT family N-acetyltransferase [Aromatoleum diolicum]
MRDLKVRIASSAAEISQDTWNEIGEPGHPFLNGDFLRILEESGVAIPAAGWQPLHLVATQAQSVVGLLPLYLKTHSHGDFIYDWNWKSVWERFGHRYYPRLVSGLPYTPVAGSRLLISKRCTNGDQVRQALVDAARQVVTDNGFSSWHAALASPADIETLEAAGLLVSHDVQFHWNDADFGDFDGFLQSFSAEKRRKVRAERRRAVESGLRITVRHGGDIGADEWPALHAIYKSTFDRFGNYAAFSPECFAELATTLGDRMVVFTASDGVEPVALSLCFRSNDTLFGRYWGARRQVDSLHFELCFYQGIDYCLREGLTRFEPGAGGEHKIARGFTPQIVRSAHWIPDPGMRRIIAPHLERQQSGVAAYRDDATTHLPFRKSVASLA